MVLPSLTMALAAEAGAAHSDAAASSIRPGTRSGRIVTTKSGNRMRSLGLKGPTGNFLAFPASRDQWLALALSGAGAAAIARASVSFRGEGFHVRSVGFAAGFRAGGADFRVAAGDGRDPLVREWGVPR